MIFIKMVELFLLLQKDWYEITFFLLFLNRIVDFCLKIRIYFIFLSVRFSHVIIRSFLQQDQTICVLTDFTYDLILAPFAFYQIKIWSTTVKGLYLSVVFHFSIHYVLKVLPLGRLETLLGCVIKSSWTAQLGVSLKSMKT